MEKAIILEDWETLGNIAHKVKPNFRMVGCSSLEEPAKELETMARKEPVGIDTIRKNWPEFKSRVENLLPNVMSPIQQSLYYFFV